MMRLGFQLLPLFGLASASIAAAAVSIDEKTEHLGFRLGSMRTELTQLILKQSRGEEEMRIVKRPRGMDNPQVEWVAVKPPPAATFGGVKVDTMTLSYVMDRLCWINIEFEHAPYAQYKDAIATMIAGLEQKYGPPTADPSKRGNGGLGRHLTWEGDNVILQFDEYPGDGFGLGMKTEQLGLTLASKSSLRRSEEEALAKFNEARERVQQKAKTIQDDL